MAYDFHDYVSHSHTVPMRFDKDSDFMKWFLFKVSTEHFQHHRWSFLLLTLLQAWNPVKFWCCPSRGLLALLALLARWLHFPVEGLLVVVAPRRRKRVKRLSVVAALPRLHNHQQCCCCMFHLNTIWVHQSVTGGWCHRIVSVNNRVQRQSVDCLLIIVYKHHRGYY